jgi:hypothetical protein
VQDYLQHIGSVYKAQQPAGINPCMPPGRIDRVSHRSCWRDHLVLPEVAEYKVGNSRAEHAEPATMTCLESAGTHVGDQLIRWFITHPAPRRRRPNRLKVSNRKTTIDKSATVRVLWQRIKQEDRDAQSTDYRLTLPMNLTHRMTIR